MQGLKNGLQKTLRLLEKSTSITGYLVAISMLLLSIVVFYGVFTRFVLNSPSVWTDQVSIYLMWATAFFGAAYTMKKNKHISVDVLTARLSMKSQLLVQIFVLVLSSIFVGFLFYSGFLLVQDSFLMDQRDNTLLRMKLYIPQLSIPLGCLFIFIAIIEQILICLIKLLSLKETKNPNNNLNNSDDRNISKS